MISGVSRFLCFACIGPKRLVHSLMAFGVFPLQGFCNADSWRADRAFRHLRCWRLAMEWLEHKSIERVAS